ncbi:MAG: ABC transporter permease [Methanomassiliicoccus sp.]|nr:ABC transporter permease [Methanomassiliicoccus sp.]
MELFEQRKKLIDDLVGIVPGREIWSKIKGNRMILFCLLLLGTITLLAVFAPFISPYDPAEQNLTNRLQSPSMSHLMGTDYLGRDIFSRVLYGAQTSLFIAGAVVAVSLTFGVAAGSLAGYFGGWTDGAISRVIDVLISFPGIILSLALIGVMGAGVFNLILALSIVHWASYARLTRGQVLTVKNNDYIASSKLVGSSRMRIMIKHILPNSIAPVIVLATIDMGHVILAAASLSFLGLGIPAYIPEWGSMISLGKEYIRSAPYVILGPGLAITLVVVLFSLLGDSLRDVLDPKKEEGELGNA